MNRNKHDAKKSLPDFQSKEKESYYSSIGVESGRVPTEAYYSTKYCPKPTPEEWNNMVNTEKRRFWKNKNPQMIICLIEGM